MTDPLSYNIVHNLVAHVAAVGVVVSRMDSLLNETEGKVDTVQTDEMPPPTQI